MVARAAHPPNAFPISVNTGFRAKSALFTAFFALFLFSTATAQDTGSIAGVVIDGDFGDSLIGANVVLEGTLLGTSTDLEGRYRIDDIPVGVYTFKYSYIGFQTTYVADVEILNGKTAKIDVTLASESFELQGEVVVEARAIRNNESVLLKDRQKADGVSDAISAEAISRSGSGDAAAAMSKVTGASVVGGKYVYIRGLGDRYTNTTLNGSNLPSADPDRKAFQLDLFPTALLDNIVTLKTFTPDRPGDFSGGLVDVEEMGGQLPQQVELAQNFPNPFNPSTTISFRLNTTQQVRLSVHDVLGREVAVLVSGVQPAGNFQTQFDATDLTSGMYIYRLQTAAGVVAKAMTLLK